MVTEAAAVVLRAATGREAELEVFALHAVLDLDEVAVELEKWAKLEDEEATAVTIPAALDVADEAALVTDALAVCVADEATLVTDAPAVCEALIAPE